jgi:anaerobic ribonucleoside-triphosphate reductase activating protein
MNIFLPFQMSFLDYIDNYSHAIVVYIMGCNHNCFNCQNKEFQDINYKESINVNISEFFELLKYFSKKYRTNKVVLSGGDPLHPNNINKVKEILLNKEYDFTLYTGYDIEYVIKNNVFGFKFIKCGKYNEIYKKTSEKNNDFFVLASENQKIYDSNYNLISNNGILYFK